MLAIANVRVIDGPMDPSDLYSSESSFGITIPGPKTAYKSEWQVFIEGSHPSIETSNHSGDSLVCVCVTAFSLYYYLFRYIDLSGAIATRASLGKRRSDRKVCGSLRLPSAGIWHFVRRIPIEIHMARQMIHWI